MAVPPLAPMTAAQRRWTAASHGRPASCAGDPCASVEPPRGPFARPPSPRARAHARPVRRRRPALARDRARPDPRLHGRRGRRGRARRLAGAALGRRAHAHGRRLDRARPGRGAARRAARPRRVHLRPRPRRDPLRAAQRRAPARPRRRHRVEAVAPARLAAGHRGRRRRRRRRRRRARQRRRRLGAVAGRAPALNVEGARAHVLADLYGSVARGRRRPRRAPAGFEQADGLAALWSPRSCCARAGRCCATSSRVLLEAAPRASTPHEVGEALAAAPGRRRGPRPARVGGHVRLPGARPPTCSCRPATTATSAGASSRRCSTTASGSPTRRCRSSTGTRTSCCRSAARRHADHIPPRRPSYCGACRCSSWCRTVPTG